MKKLSVFMLVVMFSFLQACSSPVNVPPAHKGKFLTVAGYSPDILEPGKYWAGWRESLVLIETNTGTYKETVKVILADKLTLHADVRFRGRIAGSSKVVNAMFNDIKPGDDNTVQFNEVYHVYGRMAVRNKTREIISAYNVDEVHKNYSRLSKEIQEALLVALQSTPLEISDVALGNIQYPDVVTKAIEAAEKKRLDIAREEAQAEIDLTKKKNERLLAEADYQIKITRAKAVRDENKIIGQGVTDKLLQLKQLEVQMAMAEAMKQNGNSSVFMPYEAMNSTGAQVRMYSK